MIDKTVLYGHFEQGILPCSNLCSETVFGEDIMKIVMLGAPGAGKGTQAFMLSTKFDIPHISTGDIFRANIKNDTRLGRMAREYMDKGLLVPDELTCDLVKDRIFEEDCSKGFILDGFPRTIPQARLLTKALEEHGQAIDKALNVHVPDEDIIERMGGRRVCPSCGATYHVRYKPSAKGDVCEECGADLIIREDDCEETVRKRLEVYHQQTQPLIDYYDEMGVLMTIDGTQDMDAVFESILKAIGA